MTLEVLLKEETLRLPTEPWDRLDPHPDIFAVLRRDWRAFPYPRLRPSGPRETRSYRAIVLENEFLRCSVLPELGGRLYRALDKRSGRDLFYVNSVVKPRELAIRGPWISGGVEYNFPVGHNVWTIGPVDCESGRGGDGSAWVEAGETDKITGMRWRVRQILRPGTRALETRITLENPTAHAQSYYYWSNAAVPDTPHTRLVAPFDRVYMHEADAPPFRWPWLGKADLSQTRNIAWVVSLFAQDCTGNAFGAYDQERDWGVCHVADVAALPGKKIFSWGYGPSRKRWEEELTDHDGPYLEIQAGRFDTQHDLALFPPRESQSFREFWLPVPGLGGWDAASSTLLCRWMRETDPPQLTIFSAALQSLPIRVYQDGRILEEAEVRVGPEENTVVRLGVDRETWTRDGVQAQVGPLRMCAAELLREEAARAARAQRISLDEIAQDILDSRDDSPDLDSVEDCLAWGQRLRVLRLPVEAEKFYRRAIALGRSSRAEREYREFRGALEQGPDLSGLPEPCAGALEYFTGRWDEAMEIWRLRSEDGDAVAAHCLGLAALEQKADRHTACECFLAAHRLAPGEPLYLQRAVGALFALHRLPEAQGLLEDYGQREHSDVKRLWVALRVEQEAWSAALDLMMNAHFDTRHLEISLAWLWVVVHTRLGLSSLALEQQWHFYRAAQFIPAWLGDDLSYLGYGTEALVHLGDSFLQIDKPDDARMAWEKAAREPRGPLDSLTHWKAKALENLGYPDAARTLWERMGKAAEWRLAMRHPARPYLLYLKSLSAYGLGDTTASQGAFHAAYAAGLTWMGRCRASQDVACY